MQNNNFGIYNNTYEIIIIVLNCFPEIEKAIIFGSRAMGNYKKGSDIDIAILGNNINDKTITRLSATLNEEKPIPYFIDIVNYNSITNIQLKEHIDKEGKVLFRKE